MNFIENKLSRRQRRRKIKIDKRTKRILDNIISNVDLQFQQAIKRKSKNKPKKKFERKNL